MTQAIPKPVTFDEFIAWYPENSEHKTILVLGQNTQTTSEACKNQAAMWQAQPQRRGANALLGFS